MFKSNDRNFGYNLTEGGDGPVGMKHSEITKKLLSEKHFGVHHWKYGTKNITKRLKENDELTSLAKNIYKNDYWNVFELDDIPSQNIAHQMFDTAVNCGISRAIRIAQQVIGMNITGKWSEELKYNLMQYGKEN